MTETLEERVARAISRYAIEPPEEAPRILAEIVAMCREVRPLVWRQVPKEDMEVAGNEGWEARDAAGRLAYSIERYANGTCEWGPAHEDEAVRAESVDAAKAAAEAHHAERVRGMLK